MQKRIIVSLVVIALAAALIGGATYAWFTDSDETEPTTFTAGTLLIDIDNFKLATEEINLDILNPGDEWEYTFDVKNDGSKRLIFTGLLCYEDKLGKDRDDIDFGGRTGYGTNPLSEVLELEITVVGQDAPFYKGTLADYDNQVHPYGGYPKGLKTFANPPIVFGEAQLNPEGTQQSLSYHVKITFPTTAGNEYQGSQLKAAFAVLAKQIHPDAEYGDFVCPLHGQH